MLVGNEVIYQVFVRNHTKEGTFKALEKDLKRIKELGVDIIYLMPINEIGLKNRKGTYGSPYASKDYFSISKDLGNLDDLKSLINKVHKYGMKIIVDMVFNHTAPDSILFEQHPEFYYKKKDGNPGNRVGEWSDIIDLDTSRKDTQDYLISVLQYWKGIGFDGYRFDVASMIDFNFFKRARLALGEEVIFLAEAIDFDFADYLKSVNIYPTEDKDLFPVFDCCYNYSWYRPLEKYFKKIGDLKSVVDSINLDKEIMPNNYLRCNCVENHDCERIAFLAKDKNELIKWTIFSYSLKGCAFIYAGQENGIKHKPELFEKDPIDWSYLDNDILNLHKNLILKKHIKNPETHNYCELINGEIILKDGIQ